MTELQLFSLIPESQNSFWKRVDCILKLHIVRFAARNMTLDSLNLCLLPVWSLKYTNPNNQTCSEENLLKGDQHYFCPSQSTHTSTLKEQGSLLLQQIVWKKTAISQREQAHHSMADMEEAGKVSGKTRTRILLPRPCNNLNLFANVLLSKKIHLCTWRGDRIIKLLLQLLIRYMFHLFFTSMCHTAEDLCV